MDGLEMLIPLVAVVSIFIGMPWLFLHYTTKWKQAKTITLEDENLLDELHDIARRLDDRVHTIERIIAADSQIPGRDQPARITELRPEMRNPEFRAQAVRKEI